MGAENKSDAVVGEGLRSDHDSVSKIDEKKLVRKLDLHIIPLVMVLYLFSFLDRFYHPSPNSYQSL